MELSVPAREGVLVVGAGLGAGEHGLHVVEIAARGMQHGKARGERLDSEPRLDELQGARLIGEIGAVRSSAGADIGAASQSPRDQARLLQLVESAANGAAR